MSEQAEHGPRWYAIHCAPRSEDAVDRKLQLLGYRTFFPHYAEWIEAGRRRSRLVKLALFSRYTFVGFRPERAHIESAFQVNELRNEHGKRIASIVCAGIDVNGDRMPYHLPPKLMIRIMGRCDPLGQVHRRPTEAELRKRFAAGDKVRVHELGDPRSFLATVKQELGSDRYLVELERAIMGQDVAEISAADVHEVKRAS